MTVDDKGKYRRIVNDKTGSLWFNRFMIGLHNRMGEVGKQNKALSLNLMLKLIEIAEGRYEQSTSSEDKNKWSSFLTYAVISYVLSLRGIEGFMIDIDSTFRLKDRNDGSYMTIGLMGQVKGESHDRCHLVPCVPRTGSGIEVRGILLRHLKIKRTQGLTSGTAISNEHGKLLFSREIDKMLIEILEDLYEDNPNEFPS